jgi:hypothetical protein
MNASVERVGGVKKCCAGFSPKINGMAQLLCPRKQSARR